MIYVQKLLEETTVKHILNFYEFCQFRDGANTGPKTKDLKYNLELFDPDHTPALNNLFLKEIRKNAWIKNCLFPKKFSNPMFLKYDENMHYTFHNDYYEQNGVKTHYSVTVFLSDPSEYEGGELNIKLGDQNLTFKEPAGTAVIYPTGLWHTINKVNSGCRKVVVFWIESIISDPVIRECCHDLTKMVYNSNADPEKYTLSHDQILAVENIKYRLLRVYGNID